MKKIKYFIILILILTFPIINSYRKVGTTKKIYKDRKLYKEIIHHKKWGRWDEIEYNNNSEIINKKQYFNWFRFDEIKYKNNKMVEKLEWDYGKIECGQEFKYNNDKLYKDIFYTWENGNKTWSFENEYIYNNGELYKEIIHYEKNKVRCEETEYENGKISKKIEWKNNIKIREEIFKNGEIFFATRWHDDGKMFDEIYFKNGNYYKQKRYYDDRIFKTEYRNQKEHKFEIWKDDKKLSEIFYLNGIPDIEIIYNNKENIRIEKKYKYKENETYCKTIEWKNNIKTKETDFEKVIEDRISN